MSIHPSTHRRQLNLAGFAICALLIAAAYYLQYVEGMEPCPLCILQRVVLAALGVVFLLAGLQNPAGFGRYVYGLLVLLAAATGVALAGRHVWLQSLPPDQVPACGPGLGYLLDTFPLLDALALVLRGSGECAENAWQFLGLGIAAWALVWFALLAGLSVYLLLRPSRRTDSN